MPQQTIEKVGDTTAAAATRSTVQAYTRAWMAGDLEAVKRLVAPDVAFEDPMNRFRSADSLVAGLTQFLGIFRSAKIASESYGEKEALVLYDCTLAPPVAVLRCAEHFEVEDGRITRIRLTFDSAPFERMRVDATRSLALAYFQSWQKRDWDGMRAFLADDVELGPCPFLSPDELVAFCRDQGSPWKDVTLQGSLFSPDSAALFYSGTDTRTGARISVGEHLTFRNGKIARLHGIASGGCEGFDQALSMKDKYKEEKRCE